MKRHLGAFAVAAPMLVASAAAGPALAQKAGGLLKMFSPDSPASMSILEESTVFAEGPMMGVFNNLVMFDQHVKQTSLASIVPDLATGWSWSEDGTELTLPLHEGVRWHDGPWPPAWSSPADQPHQQAGASETCCRRVSSEAEGERGDPGD